MKTKNFFDWLQTELGVTEPPNFGNPDTELYTLNDDMLEVAIYRSYIIENATHLDNALVVQSSVPPVTLVLGRYNLNGHLIRIGYDAFSDTAFASFESWNQFTVPPTIEGEDLHHE